MTKLYELTGAYADLQARADAGDDVSEALALVSDALEAKAAGIGHVLANLSADEAALDAEIKRLQTKKRAVEHNRERLREYLLSAMVQSGITRLKAPTFTISVSEGQDAVEVVDESQVPEEFLRVKREVSKSAILTAYKAHGEIPSGVRIARNPKLTIR